MAADLLLAVRYGLVGLRLDHCGALDGKRPTGGPLRELAFDRVALVRAVPYGESDGSLQLEMHAAVRVGDRREQQIEHRLRGDVHRGRERPVGPLESDRKRKLARRQDHGPGPPSIDT